MYVFIVVGEESRYNDTGATLVARATSTPNAYDLIGVRRRIHDDTREVFSACATREIENFAVRR